MSFHPLGKVFCRANVFNFLEVQFTNFPIMDQNLSINKNSLTISKF
jgi:hypothetical protein